MLQNKALYNELKKRLENSSIQDDVKIYEKDIQYYEALNFVLEKNNQIKYLIINKQIEEYSEYKLELEKIQLKYSNIKIIEIDIKINEIKKIKIEKIIDNIVRQLKEDKEIIKNKSNNQILFLGDRNQGTTTISFIVAYLFSKKKLKIKYIQNQKNTDINIILGINRCNFKKDIIEFNEYLDIYLNNVGNIKNYDIIICDDIDTNKTENKNRNILKVYLTQGNFLSIYKLDRYIRMNEIEKKQKKKKENVKELFILNYKNKNSIDKEIIENILNKKCIGEIGYLEYIDTYINKKFNINKYEIDKIHYEFDELIEKIERNLKIIRKHF